jgi:hypothetical protein
MHHLLDNTRLDLIVEGLKQEVGGGAHDMEGSGEVVSTVGKDKRARVNEAKREVERSRVNREREGKCERFGRRFGTGRPRDEGGIEVGGGGYENESVERKDSNFIS